MATLEENCFMYHGYNLTVDPAANPDISVVAVPTGKPNIADDAILDQNGRTYHGYKAGNYFMPNDAQEQDRLDFQHKLYLLVTDGKLGKAPVESPKNVLDVATGTGIWAIQYAEQHPDCHVIGSDLSLIQKNHATLNCNFVQQDVEHEEWDFDRQFDYIHFRYVVTCFDDMRGVIKKAFDSLKPGGWIEFYDVTPVMIAVDSSFHGTAVERWSNLLLEGGRKANRDMLKPGKYAQWCREVGFVDVADKRFPLPSNGFWPKDAKMKEIGAHNMKNQLGLVDSLTKFIRLAGLSEEETRELEERTRKDIQDANIHFCRDIHLVYAQKPHLGSV